jgi:hypothetical protein
MFVKSVGRQARLEAVGYRSWSCIWWCKGQRSCMGVEVGGRSHRSWLEARHEIGVAMPKAWLDIYPQWPQVPEQINPCQSSHFSSCIHRVRVHVLNRRQRSDCCNKISLDEGSISNRFVPYSNSGRYITFLSVDPMVPPLRASTILRTRQST